jgi:PKD repeat protein
MLVQFFATLVLVFLVPTTTYQSTPIKTDTMKKLLPVVFLLTLYCSLLEAQNQIQMPLPAQSTTFSGNVRGYYFVAPSCFTITGLEVPSDASTGLQNIALLRFDSIPPLYSATTDSFDVLFLTQNDPTTGIIPVNIEVAPGDVIGILGNRADNNSYAPSPASSNINGLPVTLSRIGMQFPLSSTAPTQVWTESAGSISRIYIYYDTTTTINVVANWQGGFTYSFSNGASSAATSIWDYGDGSPLDTAYNPTHVFPGPGTYDICSYITGLCTSDTVCTQIIICPAPALADYNYTINYPSVSFTDASQNTTTWQWDFGDGNTSTLQSPSHTYATFGLYSVCLSVQDTCGGINTECKNISVCPGNIPVNLGADITACGSTVISLPGYTTYTWSTGGSAASITATNSGNYSVVVTDANGCSGTDTINVTINPLPPANLGNNITQCGGSVTLTPSGGSSAYTYNWSTGNGNPSITVTQSGNYSVVVTDNLNCSSSASVTVTINPVPLVFLGNDITICQGFVSLSAPSGTGYTYSWNTGSTLASILVSSSGTYTVVVTNSFNCSNSDTIQVTMLPVVSYVEQDTAACIFDAPFALSPGNPAGGTYSGPGVTGNIFDPQAAGLGNKNIIYAYTDTAGCVGRDTSIINVSTCTGLAEQNATYISIFPNPGAGIFHFRTEDIADEIRITDVQGRVMKALIPTSRQFDMDLRTFSDGHYLVQVRRGDQVSTYPLLIRH